MLRPGSLRKRQNEISKVWRQLIFSMMIPHVHCSVFSHALFKDVYKEHIKALLIKGQLAAAKKDFRV